MTAILRAVSESELSANQRLVVAMVAQLGDTRTGVIPDRFRPSLDDIGRMTALSRATIYRCPDLRTGFGGWFRWEPGPIASTRVEAALIPTDADLSQNETTDDLDSSQYETDPSQIETDLSQIENRTITTRAIGPVGLSTPADADVVDAEVVDEKPNLPAVVEENAGTITAAWIDHCTRNGIQMPRGIVGRYAKGIKTALDEGFTPYLIKTALAQMLTEGNADKPAWFTGALMAAQQGPARKPHRKSAGEQAAGELLGDNVVNFDDFFNRSAS